MDHDLQKRPTTAEIMCKFDKSIGNLTEIDAKEVETNLLARYRKERHKGRGSRYKKGWSRLLCARKGHMTYIFEKKITPHIICLEAEEFEKEDKKRTARRKETSALPAGSV
ncbi:hypothetical protein F8M41_010608 [Gigaspora margarita]|uniref:Uncharacterized protein n=1 Tax=Gigaspora margarita TaxID=4874 RepID=A0A8H4B406_GIGMA|nr:hypothetical protein F8M41_010608 [Gigaspora margarita]